MKLSLFVVVTVFVLSLRGQAQNTTDVAPNQLSKIQEDANLVVLADMLALDQHISWAPGASPIQLKAKDAEKYALFQQQKKAIDEIGNKQLLGLAPHLVRFLDYPESDLGNSPYPPSLPDTEFIEAASESWPAFRALSQLGEKSLLILKQVCLSPDWDWTERISAFTVLTEFNKEAARGIFGELLSAAVKTGQKGLATHLENILNGKQRFWGVAPFVSTTLTEAEVKTLLLPENLIPNVRSLAIAKRLQDVIPLTTDQKRASELFVKQIEAIRTVGEHKLTDLVPNLILFLNYPPMDISFTARLVLKSNAVIRQQGSPAFAALWQMGESAIPPLTLIIQDTKQTADSRIDAIGVLQLIEPSQAIPLIESLRGEFGEQKDEKSLEKLNRLIEFQNPAN